ncbi:hypothetical protein [Streptomyces sp. NBC_00354]|uniref:hypothetical protein n=1 Tax=Streptomyces sp. NBC_00354 TaxID=2975723 RepID=UPI002E2676F7|nr:hypothetical protein OG296_42820 [Streptomyces sp. NBC_01001]
MPVREVFRAARTDAGLALALALAGVDPDGIETVGIVGRADYLRLRALGASPSLASQILFADTLSDVKGARYAVTGGTMVITKKQ